MPQPSNNIFDCNNVSNFLSSPIGERKKIGNVKQNFYPIYTTKHSIKLKKVNALTIFSTTDISIYLTKKLPKNFRSQSRQLSGI